MLPKICNGDRGWSSPEAVLLGDVGKQHRLGPFSPSSVNDAPHPSSKAAWLGSMTMLQARGDSCNSTTNPLPPHPQTASQAMDTFPLPKLRPKQRQGHSCRHHLPSDAAAPGARPARR
mmetsp:Transcript_85973/g.246801  ORF Transcript_85973/g.246801 Transcript_85973/m.246801 type:complete len:118 (-) Transcript_85973:51-404(-)